MLCYTSAGDWERIKDIILRFIDINIAFWTANRQPGVLITNGVEVVANPAAQARVREVDPFDMYNLR